MNLIVIVAAPLVLAFDFFGLGFAVGRGSTSGLILGLVATVMAAAAWAAVVAREVRSDG